MCDPKTWLFFLFAALDNVPNSITNQTQIIMDSFGFTNLQTTLFSLVSGTIELLTISSGVNLATRLSNARAYVGVCWYFPTLLGILLVNLLPWSDKAGLLCSQELTSRFHSYSQQRCSTNADVTIRRYQCHGVRARAVLGYEHHCWTYEESHCQRYHAHWILCWERCRSVYVAGTIRPEVRPLIHHGRQDYTD